MPDTSFDATSSDAFVFAEFTLLPREHAIYEGDRLLKIGGRAFAVLLALLEDAGTFITAQELIKKVWRDVAVDEVNLRVHIASLRKALHDGREGRRLIITSVGNGYSFVGIVERSRPDQTQRERTEAVASTASLPSPSAMIGRRGLETKVAEALASRRLVTLVGPGGVGKTSLAVALANELATSYDGALFVDLTTVREKERILDGFASALGLRAAATAAELARFLANRRLLIVIDNCEHVIDAAADLVSEICAGAPQLHIIATSREALRIEGEWVYRVPSLETPSVDAALTANEALGFSGVQLFVERAASQGQPYVLTDRDAPTVCEICRRLDGIPLAIELAASRVERLGVAGLESALQTYLGTAFGVSRSTPPRHRTLRSVFEWSYATLSSFEQKLLRSLSVFRGPFTFECAAAIAAANASEKPLVYDALLGLVEKSMVATDPAGDDVRFRLLESTREYGLEQLGATGELDDTLRRHASYQLTVCEDAERQLPTRPANVWIASYRWRMDDVRAALIWSFAPGGDAAIGAALTIASITLWLEISAMEEFRRYVERTLAHLQAHPSTRAAESEVRLKLALGMMIMHTVGPVTAMSDAILGGLAIAETLSPALHMEALGAMWIDGHARADYGEMLEAAERFAPLANASSDPATQLIAARMMAWARHHLGRYPEGLRLAERVLSVPPPPRVTYGTQRVDGRVMMHALIAKTYWITGRPEAAKREAHRGLDAALEMRHDGTLCYLLALGACPVALWAGDIEDARRLVRLLIETATRASLGFWLSWGQAFDRALDLGPAHGLVAEDLGFGASLCDCLVTIRADLLDGPTEARIHSGALGWALPEVQRAKAVRLAASGNADGAERLLEDALATAKHQGALSWELRIAMSLAELRRGRDDAENAHALLRETLSRFTERSETADHRNAAALLASLAKG
ncbi:MAG TPA: winged helix-turn-helix domain-containing protein [Kofleriaceae bacterium]